MSVAISIIIPVYNGAIYLKETIRSLQNQTYSDFEIICVDDSSTDTSLAILQSFAESDERIKLFSKPNGGTAAKSIIYGLQFATGKYFMYASQDDLFSSDLLEKGYAAANSSGADAVVPDMVFYWGDGKYDTALRGINGDRSRVISGREALVLSLDWTIHGFVLWNMNTVRTVGFYDFGLNSDEYTTRMLYFNSKRVAFSDGVFFYRQNNVNAITKKWNIKQLDCFDTSNRLAEFLIENNFDKEAINKANKTILIDLLRIQLMFLNIKKNLTKTERGAAVLAIKKVYQINLETIKALYYDSAKHTLIKKAVSAGYSYFLAFTFLYRQYLKTSYGKR